MLFSRLFSSQSSKKQKEQPEKKSLEEIMAKTRETQQQIEYQNDLLGRVNEARAKYKEDGDLDAVIKVFEYAFREADPPCISSQNLDLVDFYIKAGLYDKAWGYLEYLNWNSLAPLEKIRFAQARISKKENRYLDAIQMYMLGYLAKSEWNDTFQKDMFMKDIQSSANKLGWDNDKREYLAYLVGNNVKQGCYDGLELIASYKKFLYDIGAIQD